MHVMIVPPLYRYTPATFKDDINVFMVGVDGLSVLMMIGEPVRKSLRNTKENWN
jgi:hypothetical protein